MITGTQRPEVRARDSGNMRIVPAVCLRSHQKYTQTQMESNVPASVYAEKEKGNDRLRSKVSPEGMQKFHCKHNVYPPSALNARDRVM